jgi:hypothetical protein
VPNTKRIAGAPSDTLLDAPKALLKILQPRGSHGQLQLDPEHSHPGLAQLGHQQAELALDEVAFSRISFRWS